jgi:hypothetical protein
MAYAEGTTVSPEKSRMEIEQTLARYGATAFAYMTDEKRAAVGFQCKGRSIRIIVNKPDGSTLKRAAGQPYRYPTDIQRAAWVEGETRRRWRALLLVIKAKLEAVQSGIATFDDEFLAYVVMPNGQTMGEWVAPQIDRAVAAGQMPKLLLGDGT